MSKVLYIYFGFDSL